MSFIKISDDCAAINWAKENSSKITVGDEIDVWLIDISLNLSCINKCHLIINQDEIERANRYYQVKDRNRFLISRGALRTILGNYLNISASLVQFGLDINKKPFILNNSKSALHYNLSHSGDLILIAVSSSEIGADIEFIKPSFQYRELLQDYFNPDEIDYIDKQSSLERFFLLWTRKEAFVKATGKGLDNNLKMIPSLSGTHTADNFSPMQNWFIRSFNLNGQYFCTIAGSDKNKKIRFFDFTYNFFV